MRLMKCKGSMKVKCISNDQWAILEAPDIPFFSSFLQAFQEKQVKYLGHCYGQAELFQLNWTQQSLHCLTAGNKSNATEVKVAIRQSKPAFPTGVWEGLIPDKSMLSDSCFTTINSSVLRLQSEKYLRHLNLNAFASYASFRLDSVFLNETKIF